ncbi:MAG: hypothetical protein V1846_04970 [Candidatus Komeilibacteria bacterium]
MKLSEQLKVLEIAVAFTVILYVASIVMTYYLSPLYQSLDASIWFEPSAGWKLGSYFVESLLFVLGYTLFYNGIPGKGLHKGVQYGFWIWMIGTLPTFFLCLSALALPLELTISWMITWLVANVVFGILIGWMYQPSKK